MEEYEQVKKEVLATAEQLSATERKTFNSIVDRLRSDILEHGNPAILAIAYSSSSTM